MRDVKDTCRIAVVQATPVMFDKDGCLEKALRLIDESAGHGAELVVFPELFIPGYPYGMTFGFTVGSRKAPGREDWKRYYDNSLLSDGPEMQQLIAKAAERNVYLSMGYSERDSVTGTLYNANMMIAPDGRAMNHRKLKPTGSERVVWGDAERDYFPVMDTPWGPMGNLICWESYMPLARVALYQKGISLYISPNTNDNPEWQNTIRHIAIEGHCYFVNADLIFRRSDYPATASGQAEIAALRTSPAGAAAASSIPSATTPPTPCGMRRPSSMPIWICRRFPPAAWSWTAWATTPGPTCWSYTSMSDK